VNNIYTVLQKVLVCAGVPTVGGAKKKKIINRNNKKADLCIL
jgi:hypothetical protein